MLVTASGAVATMYLDPVRKSLFDGARQQATELNFHQLLQGVFANCGRL